MQAPLLSRHRSPDNLAHRASALVTPAPLASGVMPGRHPLPSARRSSTPFGSAFPQVLAAAQADAPWAYQRLFDWLGRPVAGYLHGQGAEDPEGLANEVFLRAFTKLRSFCGDEERFRSWVFTIAHNLLVDQRRSGNRRPDRAEMPPGERESPSSTESEALADLGADRVQRLLAELPPDQRDVLLMRIVADLTVERVAEALGKSPGAVKQLQRRGLAALRRRLEVGVHDSHQRRTLSRSCDVHPR